jgi:nucleotide-binding universal stress UspA family protein
MRVVAAIDPTPIGEHVLEVIGPWAAANGVEVDVLSVLDKDAVQGVFKGGASFEMTPSGAGAGSFLPVEQHYPAVVESHGQAVERAHHEMVERLRSAVAKHLPGVQASVHVEYADDIPRVICEYAVRQRAAAIMMGTRARPIMHAALFGSVSEDVIHRSPVPVLVVRRDMAAPAPGQVAPATAVESLG